MANPKEDLLKILEDLTSEEFNDFKWYLKEDDIDNGFSAIPVSQLEDASRTRTVDLMVQTYECPGALKRAKTILKKINRNDLLAYLSDTSPETKRRMSKESEVFFSVIRNLLQGTLEDSSDDESLFFGPHKEYHPKKAKLDLKSIQKFAVEVTLDPDTAHPALILSDDGKGVYDGHERQDLPNNPERFSRCVNVLGRQSFSTGKFYFEVQVKGKTAWALGVVTESIKRKGGITANPRNGYWTIMLTNKDEYEANDDVPVSLSLKSQPRKVGVFVDYEDGLVSFYDVDASNHLYSFTGCVFTEKLYPFLTPFTNNGGRNSAPLIITPVNRSPNLRTRDVSVSKEEYERKKAELQSVQQFAVEVTLDPDSAHPNLILSDDGKQVYHGDERKKLPFSLKRFNACVNVLGKQSFSSGKFYYEVQVKGKTAWTVGVASESINRREQITLRPENGFWTIWLRNEDEYTANDDPLERLSLRSAPQKVGVFVDYDDGQVSFYNVGTADLLYSFTGCCFTENLLPYFSPCTNDGGRNSAPLIVSPVSEATDTETDDFSDQKEDQEETKKAELQGIQQFAVEVTLDPDSAHPNLILSDDGKQVYHGDVRQKLPFSLKRFNACVNVLAIQSFSSGKFYYEVEVKGKTAWDLGVVSESISRRDQITVCPENGFWSIWLRNKDEYTANDDAPVRLCLKSTPHKVGVFVDYDDGRVSFYNVDTADLLYSFTGCCFTENLLPYFSPCTNNGGRNSAPLIVSPVSDPVDCETCDQKEANERKSAELKHIQQFAVEVTLDPDTVHPNLILSKDGKQVHHGDERQKLPYNPKRFKKCVNVLGKESFSSGKFYYEVQVKGKTAWDVGIVVESIDRKGDFTLSPLSPEEGIWIICLRNGDEYQAIDNPIVSLSLKSHLEKVGVFVDYDEGLISFYDADSAELLHSFTGGCFTENLLPFFSPCNNNRGRNSAPLVICPVSLTD